MEASGYTRRRTTFGSRATHTERNPLRNPQSSIRKQSFAMRADTLRATAFGVQRASPRCLPHRNP